MQHPPPVLEPRVLVDYRAPWFPQFCARWLTLPFKMPPRSVSGAGRCSRAGDGLTVQQGKPASGGSHRAGAPTAGTERGASGPPVGRDAAARGSRDPDLVLPPGAGGQRPCRTRHRGGHLLLSGRTARPPAVHPRPGPPTHPVRSPRLSAEGGRGRSNTGSRPWRLKGTVARGCRGPARWAGSQPGGREGEMVRRPRLAPGPVLPANTLARKRGLLRPS